MENSVICQTLYRLLSWVIHSFNIRLGSLPFTDIVSLQSWAYCCCRGKKQVIAGKSAWGRQQEEQFLIWTYSLIRCAGLDKCRYPINKWLWLFKKGIEVFFLWICVYCFLKLLLSGCVCFSLSVVSDSLRPHGLRPTRLLRPSMGFSRQEYWSGVPLPSPSETLAPAKKCSFFQLFKCFWF